VGQGVPDDRSTRRVAWNPGGTISGKTFGA